MADITSPEAWIRETLNSGAEHVKVAKDQVFECGGNSYSVPRLWELSKNLPMQDLGAEAPDWEDYLDAKSWTGGKSPKEVLESKDDSHGHYSRIKGADLRHPVIIAPNGGITDGMHRIAKAKMTGKELIRFKKFDSWEQMQPALIKSSGLVGVDGREVATDDRWQATQKKIKLQREALQALVSAQNSLPSGYKFKILDGHRTLRDQKKLVSEMEAKLRKSNPDNWKDLLTQYTGGYEELKLKGSDISFMNHRSGRTIDITLMKDGVELDMGLSPQGGAALDERDRLDYQGDKLNEEAKVNRKILQQALESKGFANHPDEWWHWGYKASDGIRQPEEVSMKKKAQIDPIQPVQQIEPAQSLSQKQKELEAWQRWSQNKNPEDFKFLLESFKPFMYSMGRRYFQTTSLPKSAVEADMIQHFHRALETYDPNKGAQLNTHIGNHLQHTGRYLRTYQNIGKIPEPRARQIGMFQAREAVLNDTLGRPPSAIELSDDLGLDLKEVELLRKEVRKDILIDPTTEGLGEIASRSPKAVEQLRFLHMELSPEQQNVLEHTYGLYGQHQVENNKELAKLLGMTEQKVRAVKRQIARRYEKRFDVG